MFFVLSNLSCTFPIWIHVSMLSLSWWRHQRETLSALLSLCVGNAPVNSPHKDQWRGALMLCLICAWRNGVNNREAGDLRRHRDHYDVTLMILELVYIYLHACMYRVRACGLKAVNKKSDSKSEHIMDSTVWINFWFYSRWFLTFDWSGSFSSFAYKPLIGLISNLVGEFIVCMVLTMNCLYVYT